MVSMPHCVIAVNELRNSMVHEAFFEKFRWVEFNGDFSSSRYSIVQALVCGSFYMSKPVKREALGYMKCSCCVLSLSSQSKIDLMIDIRARVSFRMLGMLTAKE